MKSGIVALTVLGALAFLSAGPRSEAAGLSAQDVVAKLLDADPWGMGGAVVSAHAVLKDKRGSTSSLAFSARSRRHDPPFSKSMVRFTAPADLAGAGFLQIQNRKEDDGRFLFLPELKRSRRISGNLRGNSFMGTDFSFADLDRRDLREATVVSKGEEAIGKYPCYHLDSVPTRSDSPYSHVEIWVREDNFLPLKMTMYDHAKVLQKTFAADEVRQVNGHWYITKSHMIDHIQAHETALFLDSVAPASDIPEDEFTVRNLEKF